MSGAGTRLLIALLLSACQGSSRDGVAAESDGAGSESTSGGETRSERTATPAAVSGPADEKCAMEPVSAMLVLLHCPRYELKILRPVSAYALLLDEYVRRPGWVRGELELGGRSVAVGRFNADGAHGARVGVVVLSELSGRVHALTCFSDRDRDRELRECRQVLSRLIEHGLPDEIRFAPTPLTVGDKALHVPEGCRFLELEERIRCAGAELHYRNPGARQSKSDPEARRAELERVLGTVGRVERTRIACRALGKDQTCDAFGVVQPNGTRFKVIVAMDDLAQPALQCNILTGEPTHYPPPCDQVFEGRPQ